MNKQDVGDILSDHIKSRGLVLSEWARIHNVDKAHVSRVIHGKAEAGAKILKPLKLRREISYWRK